MFAEMARLAGEAIAAEAPGLPRVLGGISPIDPAFIRLHGGAGRAGRSSMSSRCTAFRSTGTTGRSTSGRHKLDEIRAVTDLPVWVSEVGVSTLRRRGGAGIRAAAHRRAAASAGRRASTGTASTICRAPGRPRRATRGGGLVLLPPFLHGPAARGRHAEARRATFPRVHAGARHLPVVPFRGPPARRRGALAEASWASRYLRTGLSWAD